MLMNVMQPAGAAVSEASASELAAKLDSAALSAPSQKVHPLAPLPPSRMHLAFYQELFKKPATEECMMGTSNQTLNLCLGQDLDDEYEAALERRRLEVEAERRLQEEEDARLLRALTAQEELPGECQSAVCSERIEATCIQPCAH